MKGIELPINVLIVIIIAVVVLIALVFIFTDVYTPAGETLTLQAAKENACQKLLSLGCFSNPETITINNFDADKDGKEDPGADGGTLCGTDENTRDNLLTLGVCWYGYNPADTNVRSTIKRDLCGCR